MKRLFAILWSHAPLLVILAAILGSLSGLCNTFLLGLINDTIHSGPDRAENLWPFIGLALLLPLSVLSSNYTMVTLTQKVNYHLRMSMVDGILTAPLRRLETLGDNKLLAALTGDVSTISQALSLFPMMFMQLTIIGSCMVYLSILFWPAAAAVVLAMVAGVGCYRLIQSRGMMHLTKARDLQDILFQHFRSLIFGVKELKLHQERSNEFVTGHVHPTANGMLKTLRDGSVYFAIGGSLGRLIFFSVIGACLFWLPQVQPHITSEILTGYAIVILFLIGPMEQVMMVIPIFGRALISLKKVDTLGARLTKVKELPTSKKKAMVSWKSISLKGLTHTYHVEKENSMFTLGPINLEFRPGETVFIVGGNGSGKTTLAKLILSLYLPKSGHIEHDGQVIDDQNRTAYRQLFTAIYSDFYLFEEFLGIEARQEAIEDYLELLILNHKVTVTDRKLSTTQLSQGQRKRLALLTAYLEDRQIYLFDEWAADQDPQFKRVFYEKLIPELKAAGKTAIVITHDDAYFHLADRIIKLDYGQVVEGG